MSDANTSDVSDDDERTSRDSDVTDDAKEEPVAGAKSEERAEVEQVEAAASAVPPTDLEASCAHAEVVTSRADDEVRNEADSASSGKNTTVDVSDALVTSDERKLGANSDAATTAAKHDVESLSSDDAQRADDVSSASRMAVTSSSQSSAAATSDASSLKASQKDVLTSSLAAFKDSESPISKLVSMVNNPEKILSTPVRSRRDAVTTSPFNKLTSTDHVKGACSSASSSRPNSSSSKSTAKPLSGYL